MFGGDWDRNFYAYDARTGKVLWKTRLPTSAQGFPISYAVNGRQYVAVPAGTGGASWSTQIAPEAASRHPAPGRRQLAAGLRAARVTGDPPKLVTISVDGKRIDARHGGRTANASRTRGAELQDEPRDQRRIRVGGGQHRELALGVVQQPCARVDDAADEM